MTSHSPLGSLFRDPRLLGRIKEDEKEALLCFAEGLEFTHRLRNLIYSDNEHLWWHLNKQGSVVFGGIVLDVRDDYSFLFGKSSDDVLPILQNLRTEYRLGLL
jgi:hypothetical protein